MIILLLALLFVCTSVQLGYFLADGFRVGVGIADITGPVTDITFMGYADWNQIGQGLLQRLYARAYIVVDEQGNRVVFVNTDTQSMGDIVKQHVVDRLQKRYGSDLYTIENVMLSSTHSHSGMGGYLQYVLFEISVKGWIAETTEPMIAGIVRSIVQAHDNLQDGSLTLSAGNLLDANINRSPAAYLLNPPDERAQYLHDVDKTMTVLGFHGKNDHPVGLISWFAVHGVSVNNTNRLVNGDNKGYAAHVAEKHFNSGALPGKGPFVAGFAQSNEGDVSPNVLGAFCTGTDIPCDGSLAAPCPSSTTCNGRGPGWQISDYESNRIIGQRQADKAIELFESHTQKHVMGAVDFRQKYWDITKTVIDGKPGLLCPPAMGYGFGAGTTDGPALSMLHQNMTKGTWLLDFAVNLLMKPSKYQKSCHAPKPVLINTGEIGFPYAWQPTILDVQLLRIGDVVIAGVPAEFTTMSGRRLRNAIKRTLEAYDGYDNVTVVLSGPANGYASYVATFEEYQMQRFEGAATAYGPYTLQAYIQVFQELAVAMATGQPTNGSEALPDYTQHAVNFVGRGRADLPKLFHKFGDTVSDIPKPRQYVVLGSQEKKTVSASFVAGNPRHNVMSDKTYLTVEKKGSDGQWKVVKTDDDYDTRFRWRYTNRLLGISEATIEWDIEENTPAGTYRLGYFGHHKEFLSGRIVPHQGYSKEFTVNLVPYNPSKKSTIAQCNNLWCPSHSPLHHLLPALLLQDTD